MSPISKNTACAKVTKTLTDPRQPWHSPLILLSHNTHPFTHLSGSAGSALTSVCSSIGLSGAHSGSSQTSSSLRLAGSISLVDVDAKKQQTTASWESSLRQLGHKMSNTLLQKSLWWAYRKKLVKYAATEKSERKFKPEKLQVVCRRINPLFGVQFLIYKAYVTVKMDRHFRGSS